MYRCAFLTLAEPQGFFIDDELTHAPLAALGWLVETVPWQRPGVPWHRFDAVVIRSTWDYPSAPEQFLATLAEIEAAGTPLFNDLALVRWNLEKTYLAELAARGVPVVPTLFRDGLAAGELGVLLTDIGGGEVVIKPRVGLNSTGAFRLPTKPCPRLEHEVEMYYAKRPLLAQPFVRAIVEEGELSLFYFSGEYSHALLKTPKATDFRVQEEHGASLAAIAPNADLRRTADAALAALGRAPLYARVDLVRANTGDGYWLMELELIEPSLYFRFDAEAPARFARAFVARAAAARANL